MHFTKRKIEEVVMGILGEEGSALMQQLTGRENVSEFDLAKKTNTDIKIIRRMLYMLYNHNLVGFIRKKDKEKGWYIYYWTLLPENIKFDYYKMKREQLEKLKQQLEEEHKELFFVCPNKCVRLNFDQSMDFEFHCPECGELIAQDEDKNRIKTIQTQIEEISTEFKTLQEKRKVRRQQIKIKKKIVRIDTKKKMKDDVAKKSRVDKAPKKILSKKKVSDKTTVKNKRSKS